MSCAASFFDQGSGFKSEDVIIEKPSVNHHLFSMNDSRSNATVLVEILNVSHRSESIILAYSGSREIELADHPEELLRCTCLSVCASRAKLGRSARWTAPWPTQQVTSSDHSVLEQLLADGKRRWADLRPRCRRTSPVCSPTRRCARV